MFHSSLQFQTSGFMNADKNSEGRAVLRMMQIKTEEWKC